MDLDDRLGLFGGVAAGGAVVLDLPFQVVDRVQEHVAQAGHVVGDVARHRQVQQQHGAMPALAQRVFHLRAVQDRRARGGGGNHHVGLGQVPVQFFQRQGDAAVAAGQVLRVGEGAVGHQQAAHLAGDQVAGHQFDGLAGADQQHVGFVQPGERFLRQPHRGGRHADRVAADGGLGAGALGGGEGLLEGAVQRAAEAAGAARVAPGLLHLAEDLRLAQHQRVQPGRHPEQVAHRVGLVVAIQVGVQVVAGALLAGQPVGQRIGAVVAAGVDLGAVAGGQQHRLLHAGLRAQRLQRPRQRVRAERHRLAQGNRRGLVVDAEDVQGHA